ncbi:MAG TPA: hypothetical protein VFY86_05880 [Nocardioides sp.]|nr:hypothetical protein [Nocardioides sp.]
MTVTTTRMPPAAAGPEPRRPSHPRLTVLAAALSVLGVLVLPGTVAYVVDLAVPDRSFPVVPELSDDAQEVVRRTGADVIGRTVTVPVRPGTGVPALAPDAIISTSEAVGKILPLGVRGLVPMSPTVAPPSIDDLAGRLTPWTDRVFAEVGDLAVACLADPNGPAGCKLSLLVQWGDQYYSFPGQEPARFVAGDAPMAARTYDVVGGNLVVGRMPASLPAGDVSQVIVSLQDHSIVPGTIARSVAPGDVVWWTTRGGTPPVSAAVVDAGGGRVASFVLAGT